MGKYKMRKVEIEGIYFWVCNHGKGFYEIFDSKKKPITEIYDGWDGVNLWLSMNYKEYSPDKIPIYTDFTKYQSRQVFDESTIRQAESKIKVSMTAGEKVYAEKI